VGNNSSTCQVYSDSSTGNGTWQLESWIGDPTPDWNDYTIPGCIEITPYISPYIPPYQPWYPEKEDRTDELKKFIEESLSKREEKTKEEDLMNVFEITVIDRRECEILHEQKIIAKDKETAMLELDLTPEIKKKVRKNLVEFIFNEIGSFTKAQRKIKVKDLVDEED